MAFKLYIQRSSTWLTTFFFLVFGISIGVFTELALPSEEKGQAISELLESLTITDESLDHSHLFFRTAGNHMGVLFVTFLSGLVPYGFPGAWLAITGKGVSLGFTAALLMEAMGFRGVLASITSILPAQLLILPALFLAAAAAINHSWNSRSKSRKKSLSHETGPYCFCFLIPLLLLLVASLWEAFISPAWMQLIKSQ